ncbi:hypothetical protein JOF36_006774 [Pseudonocardia parietis]|uniref:Uncharacterized protein n=1 Tax=Pseudonocardia parietis TaxID=570936 RepID=A0ABS4W595_9PSEU|nr:hypothetical protein [Pseudonocardia parietis]
MHPNVTVLVDAADAAARLSLGDYLREVQAGKALVQ